jgi:hypothetical protein
MAAALEALNRFDIHSETNRYKSNEQNQEKSQNLTYPISLRKNYLGAIIVREGWISKKQKLSNLSIEVETRFAFRNIAVSYC